MSKEIEALEIIKQSLTFVNHENEIINDYEEECNIIEKSLIKSQEQEKVIIELCEYCGMSNLYPYDNLEEIEITFKDTFDNYQLQRITSLERLNKQEKILSIIKEKNVDFEYLSRCNNVKEYNAHWCYEKFYLTQQEFDLLKRWLDE